MAPIPGTGPESAAAPESADTHSCGICRALRISALAISSASETGSRTSCAPSAASSTRTIRSIFASDLAAKVRFANPPPAWVRQ